MSEQQPLLQFLWQQHALEMKVAFRMSHASEKNEGEETVLCGDFLIRWHSGFTLSSCNIVLNEAGLHGQKVTRFKMERCSRRYISNKMGLLPTMCGLCFSHTF